MYTTVVVFNKKTRTYERIKLEGQKGSIMQKIDMLKNCYVPVYYIKNGQVMFL